MSLKEIGLMQLFSKIDEALKLPDLKADLNSLNLRFELKDCLAEDSLSLHKSSLNVYANIAAPLHHPELKTLFGEDVSLSIVREFSGTFTPRHAKQDDHGKSFDVLACENQDKLYQFNHDGIEERAFFKVSNQNHATIVPLSVLKAVQTDLLDQLLPQQKAITFFQTSTNLLDRFDVQEKEIVLSLYDTTVKQIINNPAEFKVTFSCERFSSHGANKAMICGYMDVELGSSHLLSHSNVCVIMETDCYGTISVSSITINESTPWQVSTEDLDEDAGIASLVLQKIDWSDNQIKQNLINHLTAEDAIYIIETSHA